MLTEGIIYKGGNFLFYTPLQICFGLYLHMRTFFLYVIYRHTLEILQVGFQTTAVQQVAIKCVVIFCWWRVLPWICKTKNKQRNMHYLWSTVKRSAVRQGMPVYTYSPHSLNKDTLNTSSEHNIVFSPGGLWRRLRHGCPQRVQFRRKEAEVCVCITDRRQSDVSGLKKYEVLVKYSTWRHRVHWWPNWSQHEVS